MSNALSVMLVESDVHACEGIINYASTLDTIELAGVTNSATRANELVREVSPDVIVLDLELHNGEGTGFTLLKMLQDNPLGKRPYIVITTENSSPITYTAARELGADYIFSKKQIDYSAQTVIDFLHALKNVIQREQGIKCESEKKNEGLAREETRQLVRKIYAELNLVGISIKSVGYNYLAEGILLALRGETKNVCTKIGEIHGKTSASVERAMQNAIDRAWGSVPVDDLFANYTAKINSSRGVPTLTEFIYYYVNKIQSA